MTTIAAAGSLGHGTLVLMLIGCVVLALAGGFATWSAWHREKVYEPRSGFSRARQAEHLRAVPAGTVMFTLWALLVVVILIWGQHSSAEHVAVILFGLGGLGAGLVAMAAGIFGRPSWVIPPALRTHRGPEHPQVFDGKR